ncbi:MAG: carbon-nitrogen hydrolase family protein [Pirellulaceae bacterium]|nr:carbon-nitrogen hydrolase family protein [Pirellulaceae bacterium]
MLLACVQTNVVFADVSANVQRVIQWLDQAADQQADMVVMPECMLSGYAYDSREAAWEHAVRIDDPLFTELAQVAARGGLHFSFGFLERAQDRLFNASALIGPEGVVGHYRKIHLPHLGVDRFVDRGDFPYAVHTANSKQAGPIKIGLAICYDCSFPEPMRLLGLAGADIIALGTNWPSAAARTAELVPPARSMENHLFFAAANRVGEENGFQFCGRSSICGPDGKVFTSSNDDQETMLLAEVDPQQARCKRIERTPGKHVIDRFADRRPEFYEGLASPNP